MSKRAKKAIAEKRATSESTSASNSLTETDVRKVITDGLHQRTESLYGDSQYADLTIKRGDRTFQVHKAIVCTGSDVFRTACKTNEAGGFKEGLENTITLSSDAPSAGDDPRAISCMIEYLYKADYSVMPPQWMRDCSKQTVTRSRANVFAAAEKYNVKGLRLLAEYKFKTHLAKSGVSVPDLATSIRVAFTTTAEEVSELRSVFKEYLVKARAHVTGDSEVRSAVESIDGLSYELFQKMKQCATGAVNAEVLKVDSDEDIFNGW